MELGEILEQIKKRWIASERYELIAKLDEAPYGAATGTESMALMGGFLLRLRQTDKVASAEINDLIETYIECCTKYGLTLRIREE